MINGFICVYRRWSHVFVLFVSEACFCENPQEYVFYIFAVAKAFTSYGCGEPS